MKNIELLSFIVGLLATLANTSILDAVSPPITSPAASTIWQIGATEVVTWNASGIPEPLQNGQGTLVLGHLLANGTEQLMLDTPLAKGFKWSAASVNITVPPVSEGTNYIVVLFGDEENMSPQFTITGNTSSESTSTTSTQFSATSSVVTPLPPSATLSPSLTMPITTITLNSTTSSMLSSTSSSATSAAPSQIQTNSGHRTTGHILVTTCQWAVAGVLSFLVCHLV